LWISRLEKTSYPQLSLKMKSYSFRGYNTKYDLAQESKPVKYLKNKRVLPLSTGKCIPYLLLLSLFKRIRHREGTTGAGKIGHL
jgi:hypothetical protein